MTATCAAIVLSGGASRRLGGTDKASLRVGGASLLDHALAAAAPYAPSVVVGPATEDHPGVSYTRENPPGGGPVAGIAAGLEALDTDTPFVLVMACDMPRAITALPALVTAADTAAGDGAWAVDAGGRTQPLLAVYRRDSLVRGLAGLGDAHGASMRALTADLIMIEVPVGDAARDADTWDDVRALREEIR
ncbi:molybdenum cofactor guanylyltransferase [Demequina sp. SO4-13]|uniref:molybdenum cofactor guanylyltransferase n=1 Tax=Demequina sp. SO4-13 TaxID=3401027 RepID=UPI003AF73BF9